MVTYTSQQGTAVRRMTLPTMPRTSTACWARYSASTLTQPQLRLVAMFRHRITRFTARLPVETKYLRWASGIHGGFLSIARPKKFMSAMSVRTRLKRWTWSNLAEITAGVSLKARFAQTRDQRRAIRTSTSRQFSNTGTRAEGVHVRLQAATFIAETSRAFHSERISSGTTALARFICCIAANNNFFWTPQSKSRRSVKTKKAKS